MHKPNKLVNHSPIAGMYMHVTVYMARYVINVGKQNHLVK